MSEKERKLPVISEKAKLFFWCAFAFVLTAACCLVANMFKDHFPFGEYSILYSDMATEFHVYLTELWDKVHGSGSIFYSWRTALGGVYWGNFMYYDASPLNIFVLLFKRSSIDEVIAILVWFRQAFAAVAMCLFLSKRRGGKASFAGAVCGIMYAFCGWSCGYYFVSIWLDVFMLMPLLLLGIEYIIDKKRIALYSAVLGIMLFSNFYMAYFACVFAVIYWLWYFFTYYKFREYVIDGESKTAVPFFKSTFFRRGTMFAAASVLPVVILGFALVPLLLQMSRNTANVDVSSKTLYFKNITEQFSALFSGADFKTHMFKSYPSAYTGVLSLLLVPAYFMHNEVAKKEKLSFGIVLGFMVLSFNIPALDYFWHGMRFPTNYVFREAFIFSVVAIIMVHKVLCNIKTLPAKAFIADGIMLAVIVGVAVVEKTVRAADGVITTSDIIVTLVLFILFAGVVLLMRYGRKEQFAPAVAFMLVLCLVDSTYTYTSNIRSINWTQPEHDFAAGVMTDLIEKAEESENSLFFRTEIQNHWVLNDGALFGYNGVRQSSSMTAESTFKFMKDLGADSNKSNFVECYMPNPAYLSFLGVRHVIERQVYADYIGYSYLSAANESYRLAEATGDFAIYKLGNALPLGFAAKSELADWVAGDNAVDNQITLFKAASGESAPVFTYCDDEFEFSGINEGVTVEKTGDHLFDLTRTEKMYNEDGSLIATGMNFAVTAKRNGMLYVYVSSEIEDAEAVGYIVCAGDDDFSSIGYSTSYCAGVYGAAEGEDVNIQIYMPGVDVAQITVRVFQTDPGALNSACEAIRSGGELELTEFGDTHFKGNINVKEDGRMLCLTVPFDPGWTVKLDGAILDTADIVKVGGALYGIHVTPGEHTVEFDFSLQGLMPGIAISALGIAAAAVWYILRKKEKNLITG